MNNTTIILFSLILSVVFSIESHAHSRSQSFSQWYINGENVTINFNVLSLEVTRLAADVNVDVRKNLSQILAEHLIDKVQASVDGLDCVIVKPLSKRQAIKGYIRLTGEFNCQQGEEFQIKMLGFYDVVSAHLHYARVIRGTGEASEMVLSDANRSQLINLAKIEKNYWKIIKSYFLLGVEHILIGSDHLVFLLALLLLCRRISHAFVLITGFTLGHSITLSVAVFSWMQPNLIIIEALIGFSIAIVALETIQKILDKSVVKYTIIFLLFLLGVKGVFNIGLPILSLLGTLVIASTYLTLTKKNNNNVIQFSLTTAFGFIHGFGFADVLHEIGLPPSDLSLALFLFNIGVEFGQIIALSLMASLIFLAKTFLNDKIRTVAVSSLVSSTLGLGVYWFLLRSINF